MKKLIFILISTFGFLLTSCTRSGNDQSSKIQIKLPELKTSYSRKVGVLSTPTSLSDINCYMVFVGGPDLEFQRNTCPTKGNSLSGIPSKAITFGPLLGGFAPSSEISIEISSGNDRVIHLVGMNVISPEVCRDFKTYGFPGSQESSKPYILGTVGRLLLEPSKTVEVPISISFDSANAIEECTGPDVPHGDGDSGGNSNEPYLRFEGIGKWSYPMNKDLGTVGQCYSVSPSLYMNSSSWVDPNMSDINISVSAFNAGQFYSDASCSTPISSLVIPAGQNKSTSNYYFKAPTPLNNVTLSGWTISGASVPLQNSQQNVDFGYPKLTFSGPDKLPLDLCVKYKIMSEYFEGGPLNAPPGGLSISLIDNASFYLRASSDCSTGSATNIAPATNSIDVYLKLMSASPVGLESQISTAGYNSSVFTVQNSARDNYADSIKVLAKDNKIIRGECNPLTIRLINSDGGSVKAKNLMNLFFKAPQGAGSFYTLPDCSGASVSSIPLVAGEHELNIGFKATSLPIASLIAGKIPFQFHFGSLRMKDVLFNLPSDISFDVVEPNDPWFAQAHAPYFNGAEVVGSHEFDDDGGSPNTFKYIPLITNYSQLVSIECSATPGTGYSACSGLELDVPTIPSIITPYKYKWSSSNAASNIPRYVRFNFSSNGHNGSKEIKISNDSLYGNNFKVIPCGVIAPGGASFETLAGYTSGVVCLPANSVHTRSSPGAFTFTSFTRTGLVGHSSGTSELNGGAQSAAVIYSMGSGIPSSYFYVANLKIRNLTSGNSAISLLNPTPGSNIVGEFNNIDIDDQALVTGTSMVSISNSNSNLNLKLRNFKILTSTATNNGIEIDTDASNIAIENSQIETAGFSIYINNSFGLGNNIKIANTTAKSSNYSALYFSNTGVTGGTGIEITNSRFRMTSPGSAAHSVVKITNKMSNMIFDNNIVESDPGIPNNHLISFFSSSPSSLTASMRSNTLLQGYSTKANINIEGGYNIDIVDFSDNALVTTAGANNAVGFFNIFSATSLNIWTDTGAPANGGNLSCSDNASYIYTGSPPYTNAGTISGGLGIGGISVIMNNASFYSKRCKGL